MNNYMQMGGQRINLGGGGGSPGRTRYGSHDTDDYSWAQRLEMAKRGGGTLGGTPGIDAAGSMGYGDVISQAMGMSPSQSQMPGFKYRSQGPTNNYHEQIPMGGTPGVYAIRNDEITGPKSDWLLDEWVERSKNKGRGRQVGGRRRRR